MSEKEQEQKPREEGKWKRSDQPKPEPKPKWARGYSQNVQFYKTSVSRNDQKSENDDKKPAKNVFDAPAKSKVSRVFKKSAEPIKGSRMSYRERRAQLQERTDQDKANTEHLANERPRIKSKFFDNEQER